MHKLFLLILPFLLFAQESQEEYTPQEIQSQLNTAEHQLLLAQKMFNPWYAGPLLTGGAHMINPGLMNVQPYLFYNTFYASYNENWHAENTPNRYQLSQQNIMQTGVIRYLDISLGFQEAINWSQGARSIGFGDTSLSLGIALTFEGVFRPAMKIGIAETFPTGHYQRLNPNKNGTDSFGQGSYQTALSFRISKLFFFEELHPLNTRATFTYTIPKSVHVKGFNTYGGGFGTKGTAYPGRSMNASVGVEWSFTQKWVLSNDFVYVHSNRTKFSGNPGFTADGSPAAIGSPSNEQFSIAPGIEYNPSAFLNFIGGTWFSIAGRNSSKFVSGIISVAYTFPITSSKKKPDSAAS